MNWNERMIARAIATQVFQRRCLLLVDRCWWTGREADVLCVTRNLRLIDVEIKISRSDLKADAAKDKWWQSRGFGTYNRETGRHERPAPIPLQWPQHVWKHYYATPADIWKPELLASLPSPASGVIHLKHDPHGRIYAYVERRAKPNSSAKPINAEQVLDIARLANLRMWDAYETINQLQTARACA